MAKKDKEVYADDGPDKWRIESDARTLEQAEEIKSDKKRYNAAISCMKDKMEDIESVLKVHGGLRK